MEIVPFLQKGIEIHYLDVPRRPEHRHNFLQKIRRQPGFNRLCDQNLQIADEMSSLEMDENIALLKQAVSKLSGIEKLIILLFLENKNYEEIAEITGITQNYVRVKMNRIKKKLKLLMTAED